MAENAPDVTLRDAYSRVAHAERALRAGARGYLMKEAGGENMLAAIRRVLGGEVYVSPRMSARIFSTSRA